MAVIEPAAPTRRAAPPSLDRIRPRLAAFCAGHAIKRAIVFGSYVRGTQTRRSDLDLVIVMDTKKRFLDRYDDVKAIHDHVPDVHVEMLIYTEDELRAIAHRPFMRRILREGIVIHPWGHSVRKLIDDLKELHADCYARLQGMVPMAAELDRLYIPTRYPNGLPDILPDQAYFERDAERALDIAERLVDRIEQLRGHGERSR